MFWMVDMLKLMEKYGSSPKGEKENKNEREKKNKSETGISESIPSDNNEMCMTWTVNIRKPFDREKAS